MHNNNWPTLLKLLSRNRCHCTLVCYFAICFRKDFFLILENIINPRQIKFFWTYEQFQDSECCNQNFAYLCRPLFACTTPITRSFGCQSTAGFRHRNSYLPAIGHFAGIVNEGVSSQNCATRHSFLMVESKSSSFSPLRRFCLLCASSTTTKVKVLPIFSSHP